MNRNARLVLGAILVAAGLVLIALDLFGSMSPTDRRNGCRRHGLPPSNEPVHNDEAVAKVPSDAVDMSRPGSSLSCRSAEARPLVRGQDPAAHAARTGHHRRHRPGPGAERAVAGAVDEGGAGGVGGAAREVRVRGALPRIVTKQPDVRVVAAMAACDWAGGLLAT